MEIDARKVCGPWNYNLNRVKNRISNQSRPLWQSDSLKSLRYIQRDTSKNPKRYFETLALKLIYLKYMMMMYTLL